MDAPTFEAICKQARKAVVQRDYDQARQLFLQALIERPEAADVHYGLGNVFFLLGDLESSGHHYRQVIRIDSHHAPAHINLGAVYNRLDLFEKAVQTLRKAIQLDPNRAEAYYNLGLVYRGKGDANLALQAYREAIRVNPQMADAHLNLANIYLDRGDYHLSVSHYKKALEARPDWEAAAKGLAQAEQGQSGTKAPRPTAIATDDISERTVDPHQHGSVLTTLHQTAITADEQARQFMQKIEKDVEPAIKGLSSILLVSHGLATDLEAALEKFEGALTDLEVMQRDLFLNLDQIQAQGQKLFE